MQNIAERRIQHRVILFIRSVQRHLASACGSFHQLHDIRAAYRDRKKAHSRQHRETSSHIIRHYKTLVTFLGSQILQCSSCLVRGRIDSLRGLFFSVFFLQHLFKHTECDGRLCRRTGLGNNIDREITVSDHIDQMGDITGGNAVAHKINLRRTALLLRNHIIKAVSQKFDSSSRSQIGTADADHQQYFRVIADLLRSLLDSCELLFVIVHRKIDPAKEIVPCSAAVQQYLFRCLHLDFHVLYFFSADKTPCLGIIKCNLRHAFTLLFRNVSC